MEVGQAAGGERCHATSQRRHVVAMHGTDKNDPDTYAHELAHVKQHDWLGPAYLQLHALTKAWCYAFSSNPIKCDPLERGPYKKPPCTF